MCHFLEEQSYTRFLVFCNNDHIYDI
jgi:hypothetical protein